MIKDLTLTSTAVVEVEAGLFVYGLKLGFDKRSVESTVSQIDLVPTLSLLLGTLLNTSFKALRKQNFAS